MKDSFDFDYLIADQQCDFFVESSDVKSVRIRSFCGPHFPAFGLNTERYRVSLRIQSKCGKIRTRKTLNTNTFYAVLLRCRVIFE